MPAPTSDPFIYITCSVVRLRSYFRQLYYCNTHHKLKDLKTQENVYSYISLLLFTNSNHIAHNGHVTLTCGGRFPQHPTFTLKCNVYSLLLLIPPGYLHWTGTFSTCVSFFLKQNLLQMRCRALVFDGQHSLPNFRPGQMVTSLRTFSENIVQRTRRSAMLDAVQDTFLVLASCWASLIVAF